MNIFRFELRRLRGSMIGWAAAACCFLGLYLGMFPLFQENGAAVSAMFARFPATLQALYGMTNLDLGSVTGFISFPMKLIQELLSVGGLVLGIRVMVHDTREQCADFLFAMPVPRGRIFLAKAGAVFCVGGSFFPVIALFAGLLCAAIAPGQLPLPNLLASASLCALLFCLYASAGLLIGACRPRIRGSAAIGIGTLLFFHIVFSICKVITQNAGSLLVRFLVPVCMFDRELAARQGIIEPPFLLLWASEVALFLFLSHRVLGRRDIVSG